MCDFWARVQLRKKSTSELVQDVLERIRNFDGHDCKLADDAIEKYWSAFGIKNRARLCREEPDLCDKMKLVEQQVRFQLL
ncbi:MAG: hypothetical protein ACFFAY_02805 [Promethearchaeota archaeon]